MSSPTVSVVIPTFRHEAFVGETLESVFAQTFTDYEVIVVNDGSPDRTAALLAPLAAAGWIRYIEQPNAGQAAARNRGIDAARGAFIALLDDDDLWPPDKLAWQVEALQSTPDCVLVYGYYRSFGQVEGAGRFPESPSGDVRRIARRRAFIGSPGQTLIRADALRRVAGFDTTLWGIDDWDLYIRLSDRGAFAYQDRNALFYRIHAANASKDIAAMYRNARRMREKHYGRFPAPALWRDWMGMGHWIRRHYAGEIQRSAAILEGEGRRRESYRELASLLRIDPAYCLTPSFARWFFRTYIRPRAAPP